MGSFDPTNPREGVVDGLHIQTYFDAKGVSRSTLMRLEEGTPKELAHYMEHGIQETDAMRLGSAVDMLVFEPQLWTTEAAVQPKFGRSKADQAAKEEWEAATKGKLIVTESQYELAVQMAEAVKSAKAVRALMEGATPQPSMWWRQDGQLAKTRPDAANWEQGVTWDLKTTFSLKDRDLAKKTVELGYEIQAAMACAAARACGLEWKAHLNIWVNKKDPIDVRVTAIEAGSTWHELGEARMTRLLRRYKEAVAAQTWEGYGGRVTSLPLPKWVSVKLAEEEELERAQQREGVA